MTKNFNENGVRKYLHFYFNRNEMCKNKANTK